MRPDFPKCTKRNFEYRYLFIKTVHHVISMFLSLSTIQMENFIQLKMAQKNLDWGIFNFSYFPSFYSQFISETVKRKTIFFLPPLTYEV